MRNEVVKNGTGGSMECWRRFPDGETGAALVEYAFLLALIVLVCIAVIAAIGLNVSGSFANPELSGALGG